MYIIIKTKSQTSLPTSWKYKRRHVTHERSLTPQGKPKNENTNDNMFIFPHKCYYLLWRKFKFTRQSEYCVSFNICIYIRRFKHICRALGAKFFFARNLFIPQGKKYKSVCDTRIRNKVTKDLFHCILLVGISCVQSRKKQGLRYKDKYRNRTLLELLYFVL